MEAIKNQYCEPENLKKFVQVNAYRLKTLIRMTHGHSRSECIHNLYVYFKSLVGYIKELENKCKSFNKVFIDQNNDLSLIFKKILYKIREKYNKNVINCLSKILSLLDDNEISTIKDLLSFKDWQ